MKPKAQIWGLDIMVASGLFVIAILIFFMYTVNNSEESYETFELLKYDGNSISNSLLSEGYPENWNSSNVITIGIATNNRINQTKLENLYSMIYIEGNYSKTKTLFNTIYDYYFFLDENMTVYTNSIEGIGKPGVSKENIESKNLIKTTRFIIYENKTTPLYLYTWEE
jgi:hypothetical protein